MCLALAMSCSSRCENLCVCIYLLCNNQIADPGIRRTEGDLWLCLNRNKTQKTHFIPLCQADFLPLQINVISTLPDIHPVGTGSFLILPAPVGLLPISGHHSLNPVIRMYCMKMKLPFFFLYVKKWSNIGSFIGQPNAKAFVEAVLSVLTDRPLRLS